MAQTTWWTSWVLVDVQDAAYWGEAQCAAVEANVRKHFGEHVRGIMNLILNVKDRRKEVDAQASKQRSMEPFLRAPNPRPYRREQTPEVVCHGLLRYTNEKCRPPKGEHRLWNKDLMACLNMRHIVQHLREAGERPERFKRPKPQS